MGPSLQDNHYPVRNSSKGKLGHGSGNKKDSSEMGCESNSEERSAGNLHATFCGGWGIHWVLLRPGAGANGHMVEIL